MYKERKIAKFVRKITFDEAEKIDDNFWSKASPEDRLKELESLRRIHWPNSGKKVKKVVFKRRLYEAER